jgi:hypothetical protein
VTQVRLLSCAIAAVLLSVPLTAQTAGAEAHASNLDFSGVRAFWRIHDVLRQDREPMDADWDALFATPGYALLDAHEQRRPALTEALRLAYMPSLAAEREASRDGWLGFVLRHLVRIPEEREALQRFEEQVRSQNLVGDAVGLAQEWLPAGVTGAVPPPTISFLFFSDARGYPDGILLDLLFFRELPGADKVLGHELHHYYRSGIAPAHRPYGEDWVAWTLVTTESEGIAGLVDKGDVPGLSPEELDQRYPVPLHRQYFAEYQEHFRRADEWLAWTDSLLVRIDAEPDSTATLALRFHRSLPDNGRIMGAYMAEVIVRELGREALLDVVGWPFRFWARYNDAARGTGRAYVLSPAAMSVIERREQIYFGPGL